MYVVCALLAANLFFLFSIPYRTIQKAKLKNDRLLIVNQLIVLSNALKNQLNIISQPIKRSFNKNSGNMEYKFDFI